MNQRLLPTSIIPASLWDEGKEAIIFTDMLAHSYRQVLQLKGLLQQAIDSIHDGSIGGLETRDVNTHFCTSFTGSCSRFKLAMLDPKTQLQNSSDLLITAFSGGRLAMLDIPCGAGAVTCSALSAIAELRACNVLPREPLDIFLIAGEYAEPARILAQEMFNSIKPKLRQQSIFLHEQICAWDACDEFSTVQLLESWVDFARDCHEHLVVIANCSGFLQSQGKFESAQDQFRQIYLWAGCRNSSVIWIEPRSNTAIIGLFPRLVSTFSRLWSRIFGTTEESKEFIAETNAFFKHPLKQGNYPRVNLLIIKIEKNNG
jgi:hypothetical protein